MMAMRDDHDHKIRTQVAASNYDWYRQEHCNSRSNSRSNTTRIMGKTRAITRQLRKELYHFVSDPANRGLESTTKCGNQRIRSLQSYRSIANNGPFFFLLYNDLWVLLDDEEETQKILTVFLVDKFGEPQEPEISLNKQRRYKRAVALCNKVFKLMNIGAEVEKLDWTNIRLAVNAKKVGNDDAVNQHLMGELGFCLCV